MALGIAGYSKTARMFTLVVVEQVGGARTSIYLGFFSFDF